MLRTLGNGKLWNSLKTTTTKKEDDEYTEKEEGEKISRSFYWKD